MSRMPWQDYFMNITYLVAERSTCSRRKVGAIAVKDKHILATGYNGSPAGVAHCLEIGCLREKLGVPSGQRHEICRGIHAEQNVIVQAAVHGVSLAGATIYCTTQPCFICAKMLINCAVQGIYFAEEYPDELSTAMMQEAGIPFEKISFEPSYGKKVEGGKKTAENNAAGNFYDDVEASFSVREEA
ncbi:MAG: cytidine/deoxycytidylate deaminase family protein [Pseudomonadota bacterium]